jgi:diamine N-acetyltransferase
MGVKTQETPIYHYVIDRKQRDKRYGRTALSKALEEIRAIVVVNKMSLCYMPENLAAKPFYTSFGLAELSGDCDGV